MKIGDRVTVILKVKEPQTSKDGKMAFGIVSKVAGDVVGYKTGVTGNYWVVGLDDGQIIKIGV